MHCCTHSKQSRQCDAMFFILGTAGTNDILMKEGKRKKQKTTRKKIKESKGKRKKGRGGATGHDHILSFVYPGTRTRYDEDHFFLLFPLFGRVRGAQRIHMWYCIVYPAYCITTPVAW